jgi:hypothetical protein
VRDLLGDRGDRNLRDVHGTIQVRVVMSPRALELAREPQRVTARRRDR